MSIQKSRSILIQFTFLGALLGIGFATSAYASDFTPGWDGRIYAASEGVQIPESQLIDRTADNLQVILGEKHLTPAVQRRQAWVIEQTVERDFFPNQHWTLAWEFLNRKDQSTIDGVFAQFLLGNGTSTEIVAQLMGSAQYASYAPLFDVLKRKHGQLLGVNLSREEKAPVVKSGLAALDPKLLPPQFKMGSDGYFKRFTDAMGGHASAETLKNYFEAQCLTDDVIALTWSQLSEFERRFLVVGSFHTDFSDGVVARIRDRVGSDAPLTLRFIDAADYTRADLEAQWSSLLQDPNYGPVADYVLFVNEPQ